MDQSVFTEGGFNDEVLAMESLDLWLESAKAFRVHREVRGQYIQPRCYTEEKGGRIDRLLIPLRPLVAAGWREGAIGIEGKKSGHKIGKVVTQAIDYSRCIFELDADTGPPGMLLMLKWIFIYPLADPGFDLGSIMAQNRIGCVRIESHRLVFACAATNGIVIHQDGRIEVKHLPMGSKRGSR